MALQATRFLKRAGLESTKLAQSSMHDPRVVAQLGFDAMMRGEGGVVSGWTNCIVATLADVTPVEVAAELHARQARLPNSRS